jgi:general secretion pathway protein F
MTLPDALEAEGDHLPQIYHAIVRCGLASGSLPEALESLTGFAQSVQELRRQIAVAMLYPVFVMLLAHAIMVAFCVELFPRLKDTYQSFYLSRPSWFAFVDFLQDWVWVWGLGLPLIVVVMAWYGVRRTSWLESGSRFPFVRQMIANFHRANFAELMALLVESGLPLHEAVLLAADTTADSQLKTAAGDISKKLQAGQNLSESLQSASGLPSFFRWMVSTGDRQGSLTGALRQVTDIYRRRAEYQSEWFRLVVPIVLVVVVGGGATLVYAVSLFLPLSRMLRDLNVG